MKMLKGKLAAFCIILAMGIAGIGAGTVASTNLSNKIVNAACENDECVSDGSIKVQEEGCFDGAQGLNCDNATCETSEC